MKPTLLDGKILALTGWLTVSLVAQPLSPTPARSRALPGRAPHLADYDSELRLPNGRVDVDALGTRPTNHP